jgi:predicted nucleotidyltransferase
MVTLDRLRAERRREILRLAEQRGAHDVRVFGSVARGEAKENSDLDLLVAWEPGRSLMDHAGLVQDLQDLLGIRVHVGNRKISPLVRARQNPSRGDASVKDDRLCRHHMLERCQRITRGADPTGFASTGGASAGCATCRFTITSA